MNKDDAVKNHSEWETFADRQKSKTTMAKGAGGITHRYNLDADAYFKTSLAATYSDNRPKVEQLLSQNSSYYLPVVDMKSTNLDIVLNSYFNKNIAPDIPTVQELQLPDYYMIWILTCHQTSDKINQCKE